MADRQQDPLGGDLSAHLSRDFLEEHLLLPLEWDGDEAVVAYAGTPDPQAVGELGLLLGKPMRLERQEEGRLLEEIRTAWHDAPRSAEDLIEDLGADYNSDDLDDIGIHDLQELANQAPVIRLVNLLLTEAVDAGASDLHLESSSDGMQVRYRVDGVLRPAPSPPAHLREAIVSRIKIMAELDIAERRLPQDGRVRLRLEDRELDVRVSTMPSLHGESVVLRLLEAGTSGLGLDSLGLGSDHLDTLSQYAQQPQGMMLATGPTGSGKTTTLHAILRALVTGREKVVAVEDPVEYELPDVVQIPVKRKAGLTFANVLRSILRQDPDVLLVGEMRDPDTASISVQAALTGHLVLSTLHTNDAPSALTRVLDLGIPNYLVASTVDLVLAQRLVRTVCAHCKVPQPVASAVRERMARSGWEAQQVWEGEGCDRCHGTGYRGRTGIYELFLLDDALREAVLSRADRVHLRRLAMNEGMRSLRADGWRHVAAGRTTPEEVLRVTTAP